MQAARNTHSFSTDDIPEAVRQQVWREQASKAFVELDVSFSGQKKCHGYLSKAWVDDWAFTRIASSQSVVRRQSTAISHSDADCFLLSLQLDGESTIVQDQRKSVLHTGDIVLYDTTRPYDLILNSHNKQLVFEIPRQACTRAITNSGQVTAVKLQTLGGKTTSYRQTLLSVLMACDAKTTRADELYAALDLLAGIIAEENDPGARPRPINSSLKLQSIKNYVLGNINDPVLSQSSVATEFGISRRYLNRLFEQHESTFSSWLRNERLERCHQDLRDPACAQQSILDIACHWGFNDAAHFSRTFKNRYHLTPLECRRSARIQQS